MGTGPSPAAVPAGLRVRRPRQVHAAGVVVVGAPAPSGSAPWLTGPGGQPPEADAVVGVGPWWCLALLTADCAAVALASPEGVYGAVHVGWRGLAAGVVGRAVDTMAALGAGTVTAGLGPMIHPCCYEFAPADLDAAARSVGDEVRAVSARGAPAFDLPSGVRAALRSAGAELVVDADTCTACGPDAFSYRARRDDGRQALFVWCGDPTGGR